MNDENEKCFGIIIMRRHRYSFRLRRYDVMDERAVKRQSSKQKTLREMTKDYSGDDGPSLGYGYGFMGMPYGGYGHNGIISVYSSIDYIHEKSGCMLFGVGIKSSSDNLHDLLLSDYINN